MPDSILHSRLLNGPKGKRAGFLWGHEWLGLKGRRKKARPTHAHLRLFAGLQRKKKPSDPKANVNKKPPFVREGAWWGFRAIRKSGSHVQRKTKARSVYSVLQNPRLDAIAVKKADRKR